MKTKELKFKTNINCNSCLNKVKSYLDQLQDLESWEVDTNNPDKILTVKGVQITEEEIIDTIEEVGFNAELIKE
ncbi:cation transporter [Empedobacter stercoris]|uniref:cation transporter n=1 Tax=Empedobacter stercoris TaxID=1628248 RepID=UPI0021AE5F9D|nr:cation transporter [Empedobacter stercoris]UWX67503.1 cation transporter [Empedobacter stercoris]